MKKLFSVTSVIKRGFALLLLTLFFTQAFAQKEPVSVKILNKPVKAVLKELQRQSAFTFVYSASTIDANKVISVEANKEPIESVVKRICKIIDIDYSIDGKQIILSPKKRINSETTKKEAKQGRVVKGIVAEASGEVIPGAYIFVPGTSNGTSSAIDGSFELELPSSVHSIHVSCMGFDKKELILSPSKSEYRVVLTATTMGLDEVIVVGYGTTQAKDLTGSVSRITAKEFVGKNVINATSLLQNMAAGVAVSQSTGKPGENVRVRVRGATSLTGSNEPLYVIDGIPMDDSYPLNGMSPSDIESIDVLKDASATAIYGSRAANGVIMVTTKGGKKDQKPQFSATYHTSYDNQINNFRMLNGDEFRAYVRDIAEQTLLVNPSNYTAKQILAEDSDYLGAANTNWFDEVKQQARRHNFDISVSGGSKTSNYFISTAVMDQKGMVIGDDMRRYNARVNLDVNINDFFRIGTKLSGLYSESHDSGTSLFSAQGFRPDLPVYDENGDFYYHNSPNPVANTHKINEQSQFRFNGLIFAELEIIKNLKLKSSLAGTQDFSFFYNFSPSFLSYRDEASGSEGNSRYSKTVFDNTLSYSSVIGNDHSIDALVGISFENYNSRGSSLSKSIFALDEIYTNISSGTTFDGSNSTATSKGLFSSFFRANYKYKDRYLFTITSRYDGSSMFGANNRYGFFPSGAVAWRVSKEPFMKSVTFVDDLKIKASWGKTGVHNMSEYANRDLYSATSYNDRPGIIHSQLANRDIRWEKSTQYDLGMDFTLFDFTIVGSLGVYRKDTKDLIWRYTFPSSMSVGSIYRNIGAVRNQGIEFNVKSTVIDKEDVKLELGFNISHNSNKVVSLVPEGSTVNSSGTTVHGTGSQVLAVGRPMGSFFGYEYNGIIVSPERVTALNEYAKSLGNSYYDGNALYVGNLEYTDMNGDGIINSKDQTILGSPDPKFFGGLTASFTWKGVNIYANFGYQVGGKKLYGKALQNLPGQLAGLVDYNLYNRWSPANPNAQIPASYLEQGVARTNRLQLFDASYFRLQDFRISYQLPKIKSVNVNSMVYLSMSNLFTITSYPGVDPATVNNYSNFGGNYESSYPGIRTFSLGLNLNF